MYHMRNLCYLDRIGQRMSLRNDRQLYHSVQMVLAGRYCRPELETMSVWVSVHAPTKGMRV